MKTIKVRITGLSPLLCHNPAGMRAGGNSSMGTKKIPTPEEEAKAGLYVADDKTYYLPGEAFRSCIIGRGGSASGRKIGKRSAIACVSAGYFVVSDKPTLTDPSNNKPLVNYQIDSRRAIVNKQGIVRCRPLFEKWGATIVAEVDEDFVTVDQIIELLNIAGKVSGVGDYRPQCKGKFGRFTAELMTK